MSADAHTDDRTDTEPPLIEAPRAPAGHGQPLDAHPDVEVVPKPSAHCCGALGCNETDGLQEVTIDGYGTRVVCLNHAEHLIGRETR